MGQQISQKYLEAFACPACQSTQLLLTKEKIIICQGCLNGYKLNGEIPDFRLEHAISFKKKISGIKKKGVEASLIVISEDQSQQVVSVPIGHCVVLGRKVGTHINDDQTFVGKPQDMMAVYHSLSPGSQQLIEKCLNQISKTNTNVAKTDGVAALNHKQQYLGQYLRDPDFQLDEPSVSKTHAIVYQDEQGVHLIDLVSKNGTYINGREVERSQLKHNDMIHLGTAALNINFSS